MGANLTSYTPIAARGGKTIFEYEFERSKRLYPLVKATIAPYLLVEASDFQDLHEATDLTSNARVAVRCRSHTNLVPMSKKSRYRTAFTFSIRSKRQSGRATELAKIMAGYGTHFFYGWVSEDEQYFLAWWLINLDVFRTEYTKDPKLGITARHLDGTELKWFDIRMFPNSLVIVGTHLPGKGYR